MSLLVPTITLSGFIKSSTAIPSRKNSGFEQTSKSKFGACFLTAALTLSLVPTGTVLLSTKTLNPKFGSALKSNPKSSATFKTYLRSAAPSPPCGVGRHKKITSDLRIASFKSVVNDNLFFTIFLKNKTSSPGSYIGMWPLRIVSILFSSISTQITLFPVSARQVPDTRPT